MLRSSALIGLLGMPLAACGGSTGPSTEVPSTPSATEPASPPSSLPATPRSVEPVTPPPTAAARARVDLATMVERALAAAAEKTGVARSELVVVSSEAVVWPDGAIGCPQPGMNYTMALVPGYQIVIDARGQRLDYHATERGYMILCPPGMPIGRSQQETM